MTGKEHLKTPLQPDTREGNMPQKLIFLMEVWKSQHTDTLIDAHSHSQL